MDFIDLRDLLNLLKSIPTDDSLVTEVLKHLEAVIIPSDRHTNADLQRFKLRQIGLKAFLLKEKQRNNVALNFSKHYLSACIRPIEPATINPNSYVAVGMANPS